MADQAPVGLPGFEGLPWGSHACHFYPSADVLRDVVVPYLKAGLENDERCLLVAMYPFGAEDARDALRAALGDFERRELAKQIILALGIAVSIQGLFGPKYPGFSSARGEVRSSQTTEMLSSPKHPRKPKPPITTRLFAPKISD